MELEGKIAIVTGGGAGIGEAIAIRLAEEGADVAIMEISKPRTDSVADKIKKLGRRALGLVADATDPEQLRQAAQNVIDAFGRIDILVNNVGGEIRFYNEHAGDRFVEISGQEWNEMIDFNLKSAIRACQAVTPHMIKQNSGKIVNIASIAGRHPVGHGARGSAITMSYGVCKAGIIQFSDLLALELAVHNINVNCVCPGEVWTPMYEKNALRAIASDPQLKGMTPREYFEKMVVSGMPLGREATAADVGEAVLFFVSEKSRNITGQSLNVDAGARPR